MREKTKEYELTDCLAYDKTKDRTINICLNCEQPICTGKCVNIRRERTSRKCDT